MSPIETIAFVGYYLELAYGFRFEWLFAAFFAIAGAAGAFMLLADGDDGLFPRILIAGIATIMPAVIFTLLRF